MKKTFRNGDWTITSTGEKVSGTPLKHTGSFVFAEGEATNHFHTIVAQRPEDLTIVKLENGDYVFSLVSEAKITHPEHSLKTDLLIPPGTYHLNQRREKDWFQNVTRKIVD